VLTSINFNTNILFLAPQRGAGKRISFYSLPAKMQQTLQDRLHTSLEKYSTKYSKFLDSLDFTASSCKIQFLSNYFFGTCPANPFSSFS
jgi:hypothetical protein